MNISVNVAADVNKEQHRPEKVSKPDTAKPAAKDPAVPVMLKPDHVDISDKASKTKIDTQSEDYKIKMIIERTYGDRKVETELNFYKRQPKQQAADSGAAPKHIDVNA